MIYKPYVSIDVETTGLDINKVKVWNIAAVCVTGTKREVFNVFCKVEKRHFDTDFAWENFVKHKAAYDTGNPIDLWVGIAKLNNWLQDVRKGEKITFAGKNAGGFDIPILERLGMQCERRHRILDVGPMYYTDFGYVPSLPEINELLGNAPVGHLALDDCNDVIRAIESKKQAA